MKFIVSTIQEYEYIVARYTYHDDRALINKLYGKACKLANKVNPHSSGGLYRDKNTIINKLLGGLLTEYSVSELMKKGAKKYELEYEEINTSFIQDEELVKLGFNQIDLELKINGKHVSIEIRSSFSYKTSVGRLFGYPLINGKGAFSIIGWYTSSSKPKEIKKDYYIFGIHQYYPSKIREMLNSTVEVIIASAVSKNTLETEGYDSTLKQNGAKFRVINPIKNSTPPLDGIKEILGLR